MKKIKKGLKKQIVEKETPLKKKQPKVKKEWIIEYRHYHSNPWLLKMLKIKKGWGEWTDFSSYITEKRMLEAFKTIIKRQRNAKGLRGEIERKYEYRIKK